MADAEMEVDAPVQDWAADEPAVDEPVAITSGKDMAKTQQGAVAVRSIEGWIVLVTNVHEEATEEDITERFSEYGDIQNLSMNLDRRTGYVKGYALIEYNTLNEAREAIASTNSTKLLDQTIYTDFAFVRPPPQHNPLHSGRGRGGAAGGRRQRSRSPGMAVGGVNEETKEEEATAPRNLGE
ncbi:hypothetical protein BGX38DRAFT_1087825 [Terfezia claveryi]|nr:hypothetical protein BGX38DRAFT_1087825 [Terfezia claveryi]